MSVVAWDGQNIAVDQQCTDSSGLRHKVRKIHLVPNGTILCFTGAIETGFALFDWFTDGAKAAEWPEFTKDEFAELVVFSPTMGVYSFEFRPIPQPVHETKMAWGSGSPYALGAMAAGASARDAVKIAISFDTSCGYTPIVVPFIRKGRK